MTLPAYMAIVVVAVGIIFGYCLGKFLGKYYTKDIYDGVFFIDRSDPDKDKIAIRWDTANFDYLDDGDIVQLEVKLVNNLERVIEDEDN